ncbi:MAG: hypothetical protein HZB62_10745 [Nitrospirae bacterium]|nr:hypothetical protein [Nitrospirota bacterium]
MKLSYEQLREKLRQILLSMYILELYDDHAICEKDSGGYCRVDYSIDDAGNMTMKEPVEVQREYVSVTAQAAMSITGAASADTGEPSGYKWRVQLIDAGPDKQGRFDYPLDVIHAAAGLYEGAPVFVLSEAQHSAGKHPFGKPVGDIVGRISDVKTNAKGNEGTLTILKSAAWFRDMITDAFEQGMIGKAGQKDLIELSHDVQGKTIKGAGSPARVAQIVKVDGIDVVYDAIGGGKFMRMAAAHYGAGHKEDSMFKRLLAALKTQRPDLAGKIDVLLAKGDDVTETEISQLIAAAMPGAQALDIETLVAALKSDDKGAGTMLADVQKLLAQTRLVACGTTLSTELAGSELPDAVKEKLTAAFTGRIFEATELQAAIKAEKEMLEKLTGSGLVTGTGDIRVVQGDLQARITMLDDFFAGKVHSFKAAYAHITGDDLVTGHLKAARRLTASLETTSWAEIFGDSVARAMLRDYNLPGLDDWKKIADIVPLNDFRTQHRTRMGGYGDLPTVAQGGPYTALGSPGDEEATYAAGKKGGTEDLTMEMVKSDDAGAIRKIPVKLSRAAKRTLYKFVFAFLSANPTIYDAKALFHADHANLGSAALDATSLTARRQAMLKQTEAGSSEVIGIPPKWLIVPVDLDKTAHDLVVVPGQFTPTAPDFTRTLNMEVIVVPIWTDANNWFLMAAKEDVPTIEIGFLDGKEEPELFIQDMPNVGSMFSNDKLTTKIRHIYGGAVTDYRGADGSIVA